MKKIMVLFGMLVLMSIGAYSLTVTVDAPASNANINGTYNFTATISGYANNDNVTNCTFSTTADGIFGISNMGNITKYWNQTATASLTETASTTITINCYNSSATLLGTGTSTGVAIDNTNPVCSQAVDFDILEALNPLTVDCSASTDTTDTTYSINLLGSDATSTTETPSDGIAVFEGSETGDLGWATATCTVTDEVTKSTACTANSIWIKGADEISCGNGACEDGESVSCPIDCGIDNDDDEEKETFPIIIIIISVLVVLIILMGTLTIIKKKKRR